VKEILEKYAASLDKAASTAHALADDLYLLSCDTQEHFDDLPGTWQTSKVGKQLKELSEAAYHAANQVGDVVETAGYELTVLTGMANPATTVVREVKL
jgi:hypothetical protein